ncbi:hypothetical protein NDU88_001799 [Pleurodeles waltl]|uniref:Uncharacterized protein n=1 Tax=Pleurodeles waltl TaxID=8319 RepID=A0AAV7PC86_PLEWA|nr:hypothetical protein NDU88_001799 [Pleurodeles waltl]
MLPAGAARFLEEKQNASCVWAIGEAPDGGEDWVRSPCRNLPAYLFARETATTRRHRGMLWPPASGWSKKVARTAPEKALSRAAG